MGKVTGRGSGSEGIAGVRVILEERGMALVLVLGMLLILSILGSLSLSTSTTEMGISANFRSLHEAFFAADRAVAYAQNNPDFGKGTTVVDLLTADGNAHRDAIAIGLAGLDPDGVSTATYLGSGAPPVASLSDMMAFEAHYSLVRVSGAFPVGRPNPSRVQIETQVAVVVPK